MATLAYQGISIPGAALTTQNPTSTSADADQLPPNERGFLLVHNASGASINSTVKNPAVQFGQAVPDPLTAVAAGTIRLIGPMVGSLVDTDGFIKLTHSATASVNLAACTL